MSLASVYTAGQASTTNSSGGWDASNPAPYANAANVGFAANNNLSTLAMYGITPSQNTVDYVNGTGYWASDDFKNLDANTQAQQESDASASLGPTMDQRLAIMGPDPNTDDPAAVNAWLMKDPGIAADAAAGKGTAFQVAGATGIIPSGWTQTGSGVAPNHAGRNAALIAASIFAPGVGQAVSGATGATGLTAAAVNAGVGAGVNAGVGAATGESGAQIAEGAAGGLAGGVAGSAASSLAGGGVLGGLASLGASQAVKAGVNAVGNSMTDNQGNPVGTTYDADNNPIAPGGSSTANPNANGLTTLAQTLLAGGAGAGQNQIYQNSANNAYQSNLVNLYKAKVDAENAQNTIAVQNPAKLAGQVSQASELLGIKDQPAMLTNPRTGETYTNLSAGHAPALNDAGKTAMTALQSQQISNLLASPTTNPIPGAASVGPAPTLTAPTGQSTLAGILSAAGLGTSAIAALMKTPSLASLFKSGGDGTPSSTVPGVEGNGVYDPATGTYSMPDPGFTSDGIPTDLSSDF